MLIGHTNRSFYPAIFRRIIRVIIALVISENHRKIATQHKHLNTSYPKPTGSVLGGRHTPAHSWGAIVKLVELAKESIRLLKASGTEGVRSDILADMLNAPKRRVYDVIAILNALDLVATKRRFDGTTVTWIDRTKDYIPKADYADLKLRLETEHSQRRELQVQVAELKEQVRMTRSKLRRELRTVETLARTEFNTTHLTVRALSSNGFKKVKDSGMEVLIETHEPGMTVDPTVKTPDENEEIIRNLQRI